MAKATTNETDDTTTENVESAAEAEAKGIETQTVKYGDHDYEVPATVDDWPIEALEAAERGLPSTLLRSVLGPVQYGAFKARHNTVKDLRKLSDAIAAASGFTGALGK